MASASPLISVLLPVYNGERYLAEALDSIAAQSLANYELIAIDDGSTDGSLGILRDHATKDTRIRIVSRPNTGIVGALNEALAMARGSLIARMDADDIVLPRRFELQTRYLEAHPECVVIGCWVLRVDPDNDPLSLQVEPWSHAEIERRIFNGEGGALPHPAMMMRRATLERLGGYRLEAQLAEDVDLYLRAAEIGQLANVHEVLLRYRRHPESVSALQREAQWRVMQWIRRDTCRRRGLPFPDFTLKHPVQTPEGLSMHWARLAERHGFPLTARKYAVARD